MYATRFSDEQVLEFRLKLRAWLEGALDSRWRDSRQDLTVDEVRSFQRKWDEQLHTGGYAGLAWPTEHGGQGLGPIEDLVFYEESARVEAPEGFGRVGRLLAGPAIISRGTPEQRNRYLPSILDGTEVWCQGFSETGAGSDLAAIRAVGTRCDGGYRISGQKIWTSFAQYAQRCIVLARTNDGPRYRNLTFFLVDMRQPGVDVRPIQQISGDDEFSEVFFDGVFVADDDILGQEGEGWKVAMGVLTDERGTSEAGCRLVEVANQIAELRRCCVVEPDHRMQLDELDRQVDLLRWHVLRATEEKAAGHDWFRGGSVLKLLWSELWQESSRFGVEVDCGVHRDYWRRKYLAARAVSIYSGTNEIQRNIITDRVLEVPR